jgi:hypothetical protein
VAGFWATVGGESFTVVDTKVLLAAGVAIPKDVTQYEDGA